VREYKAGGKRKENSQDGREKRRGLGVRYTSSRRAPERDVWSSWQAVETVDGRRQRRRRRGFRRRAEEHWETAEVIRGRGTMCPWFLPGFLCSCSSASLHEFTKISSSRVTLIINSSSATEHLTSQLQSGRAAPSAHISQRICCFRPLDRHDGLQS
jgi:hypothetical protein